MSNVAKKVLKVACWVGAIVGALLVTVVYAPSPFNLILLLSYLAASIGALVAVVYYTDKEGF